jgi:hypothetical protein
MRYVLAVDLGQSIDPTAVAVLQVTTRQDAVFASVDAKEPTPGAVVPPLDWFRVPGIGALKDPDAVARMDVRYLERLPLRMPYPAQIEIIAGLLRRPPLDRHPTDLVLDQTGVGRPVLDMFRRAGLRPIGVTITAGDSESSVDSETYRVSKLVLVSRLQALLHAGELRIAKDLREAPTLIRELGDFRATYSEATGYVRFGAREGTHDDLVLSVAIGAWWASRPHNRATVRALLQ